MTGAPVRSPQIFSCSIAAARNVSPAASITFSPPAVSLAASLPMVVVLPVPLTPTTRMTCGLCDRSSSSGSATGRQHLLDLCGHDGAHFGVRDVAAVAAGRQRVGDAKRRLHAEVGADQHVLQILQRLLVELALGEDAGDVAGQLAATSATGPGAAAGTRSGVGASGSGGPQAPPSARRSWRQ